MIISSPSDYREAARRKLPPFLFHYIDGGAYAELGTPPDLTGEVEGGPHIDIGISGGIDGDRGIADAAVDLGHEVEARQTDTGTGKGLGTRGLDRELFQLEAIVDVNRRIVTDVGERVAGVDFVIFAELGEAVGADAAGGRGG
jgi:hypothetical protein